MHKSAQFFLSGCYATAIVLLFAACSNTQHSVSQQQDASELYTQAMSLARIEQSGTPGDLKTARQLLMQSAALDYMPAIHALGWMELQGIGIERDRKQAFQHFQRAAQAGYAESQYMLGILYGQGWGVDASSTDSLYWIQKAADQGHDEARSMLSRLFAPPATSDH